MIPRPGYTAEEQKKQCLICILAYVAGDTLNLIFDSVLVESVLDRPERCQTLFLQKVKTTMDGYGAVKANDDDERKKSWKD